MSSIDEKKDQKEKLRQRINNIEESLNVEGEKLHKINNVQDALTSLKRSLDKCTDALTKSLEPGEAKERFSNLLSDNDNDFRKTYGSFEEQAEVLKRKVIDLRHERDAAISEYENSDSDDADDD